MEEVMDGLLRGIREVGKMLAVFAFYLGGAAAFMLAAAKLIGG